MPMKRPLAGIVDEPMWDSMLWAGLMCASGDLSSANAIKDCQTLTGRMWRSPYLKTFMGNSFSRDMALGFMMYAAASGDDETFSRWVIYLATDDCLCSDATDNRCAITAPIWWQIDHVRLRRKSPWYLNAYLLAAALTAKPGYQLHLIGCHLLLNWQIDGVKSKMIGNVLSRRQPRNPFFQWLADKPVVLPPEPENSRCIQWAWEREDSEEAWKDSMGWDFQFMRNLMELDGGQKVKSATG